MDPGLDPNRIVTTAMTGATRHCLILLLVGALAAPCPVAFARQPDPVQKRSCDLPDALRGVTGHVLFRYTVNEAGKVNFIEPQFVAAEPPGKAGALADAAASCLKSWTYPTTSTGGAARFSVEMLLAFHYFRPAPPGAPTQEIEGGPRLPESHIEEMGALRLELADRLLKGPEFAETSGLGYVIRSNVRKKERGALIKAVEEAMATFDVIFPGAPPAPPDAPVTILMFRTEDEFNQVAAFDRIVRGPKPAGQYHPVDRTAYAFASKDSHPLRLSLQALAHETAHHLVRVRLAGGSRKVPYWIDEGIASYIELLRPTKDGRRDPFKFQRGRQAQGSFSWTSPSDRYLQAFQQHRKAGSLPDLESFLKGDVGPIDADLAYGLSWILVHYLLTEEQGALKNRFLTWLTTSLGTESDPGAGAAVGMSSEEDPARP